MNLPSIIPRQNLRAWWSYKNESGKHVALVLRYDIPGGKKKFHQYRLLDNERWEEGIAVPAPLFGIETLSECIEKVHIFEGEKCAGAAQSLDLLALTSMMGANQAQNADWAILAKYRQIKEFILVPDNDNPGYNYMKTVYAEIQKACPHAHIYVCELPVINKGDDFIDWLQSQADSSMNWDGFNKIDPLYVKTLRMTFESHVDQYRVDAKTYFDKQDNDVPVFENEPQPFEEVSCSVLPCPLETLSRCIVEWIQGLAKQMQVSEDYLVAPFLVYVGSLIGRKRALRMRVSTDWIEYPNLWGMLVGRPSMMKSPAMGAVQKPLLKLAKKAVQEYDNALKQYECDSEIWNLKKKVQDEVYKKKYKSGLEGNKKDNSVYQTENPPIKPTKRRYKTEDATVEKLGELLIENPQGILLYRDELSGWLNSFNKTGREGDRQFYLEGWGGGQEFDVDRIGRGSIHVPALCLSIFGSIQPGPVSRYIQSALKGGAGDDGFIQRFQVMVWPDAKTDWELIEGIDIHLLEECIHNIFSCIDRLLFDSDGEPVILAFTEEAQHVFNHWQCGYEKRIRSGNLPPHLEAHLAKYKKLLPALCLIIEHLKYAVQDQHPDCINAETLKDAIRWLDYFESHACRVYGNSANAVQKAAGALIDRIQKGHIKAPFTVREIYQGKHWSGLSTSEEVIEVLDYLEEKHYVIGKQLKTSGRPTKKFWVHPLVYENRENINEPED